MLSTDWASSEDMLAGFSDEARNHASVVFPSTICLLCWRDIEDAKEDVGGDDSERPNSWESNLV